MSESSDEGDRKLPAKSTNDLKAVKIEKNKRTSVHDRKTSRKRKKMLDHEKEWLEYCKFMNANLEKKKNYHESPHIVVNKSLHRIVKNSIILKNPTVSDENALGRKIFYEMVQIGKNVKIHSKNTKYMNVKLNEIAGKKIFILIDLKMVLHIANMVFF